MSEHIPSTWPFVLLALGAFRVCRLAGWDEITARLRAWLTIPDAEYGRLLPWINDHEERGQDPWSMTGAAAPPLTKRRWYVAKLIRCPWCFGAWTAAVTWVLWLAWPTAVLLASTPFALSAAIGLTAKNLDP